MYYFIAIIYTILSLYFWAFVCNVFLRRHYGKKDNGAQLFLNRHFKMYAKNVLKGEVLETVNTTRIKKVGQGGWVFISLPLMFKHQYFEKLLTHKPVSTYDHFSNFIDQSVLFFGGLIFAYSWVALRYMRELNLNSYTQDTLEETKGTI